ncbi:restriction endonuclease subunit S [Thermochromatium tepidum]|nr:restriction endonuclease subunit S [Thermochromatium tepidum]
MARITPCLENGKIARFCAHQGSGVAHGSTEFIVIRGRPGITDTNFAYYLTQWEEVRDYAICQMTGTSGRQRVPIDSLDYLVVPVPPLPEQRAIAHILGTLDDKIELNRRQNETLEAMARALFKAWFVDFEPVRAKLEGRLSACNAQAGWQPGQSLPGLPAHPACAAAAGAAGRFYDLFPDRLVESELGEIPEGWEITSLSEYSSLNPESWTKRTRPKQIRYVDLSNTKWGRVESVTNYEGDDAPSRAQRILRPLDTIVGIVRPGNGSYALISDEGLTGSTGFAVLRPLRRECAEFVYLAATSRENIERLSNLADGGAYPAVRPEIVSATHVPRVSQELINRFSQQVSPMIAGIAGNDRESRTLAQLRDALLPKLISGALRIQDAEAFLKERGL